MRTKSVMSNVTVIMLLFSVVQTHTEVLAASLQGIAHHTKDALVGNFADRGIYSAALDQTTLGKSGRLAASACAPPLYSKIGVSTGSAAPIQLRSSRQSHCRATRAAPCDDDTTPHPLSAAQALDRRHAGLASVLGSLVAMATMMQPAPLHAETASANGFIDTPFGLQYRDLSVGSGDVPQRMNTLVANVITRDAAGAKLDEGTITFAAGGGQITRGFDMAVMGNADVTPMRVGGTRIAVVPPRLAYGQSPRAFSKNGVYLFIPSDTTLEYTIELLTIKNKIFNQFREEQNYDLGTTPGR